MHYRKFLYNKIKDLRKEQIPQAIPSYAAITRIGHHFPKNEKEAAIFEKNAADLGVVESMYLYALDLYYGRGIPVDKEESNRYLEKAVEKGFVDAMWTLASQL